MKILSFDPGETTGFAYFEFPKNYKDIQLDGTVSDYLKFWGEFKDYITLEEIFFAHSVKPDIVVIEAFRLYPHKANDKVLSSFPTVEIIGIIKYLCWNNEIPFVEQGANTKKFYGNKKLRMCDLFERGRSPHIRDAVRHGLYAFDFNKEVDKYRSS